MDTVCFEHAQYIRRFGRFCVVVLTNFKEQLFCQLIKYFKLVTYLLVEFKGLEYISACMEGNYGALTGNMLDADCRIWKFLNGRDVCGQCR